MGARVGELGVCCIGPDRKEGTATPNTPREFAEDPDVAVWGYFGERDPLVCRARADKCPPGTPSVLHPSDVSYPATM